MANFFSKLPEHSAKLLRTAGKATDAGLRQVAIRIEASEQLKNEYRARVQSLQEKEPDYKPPVHTSGNTSKTTSSAT